MELGTKPIRVVAGHWLCRVARIQPQRVDLRWRNFLAGVALIRLRLRAVIGSFGSRAVALERIIQCLERSWLVWIELRERFTPGACPVLGRRQKTLKLG